jgi:hypothetical protein
VSRASRPCWSESGNWRGFDAGFLPVAARWVLADCERTIAGRMARAGPVCAVAGVAEERAAFIALSPRQRHSIRLYHVLCYPLFFGAMINLYNPRPVRTRYGICNSFGINRITLVLRCSRWLIGAGPAAAQCREISVPNHSVSTQTPAHPKTPRRPVADPRSFARSWTQPDRPADRGRFPRFRARPKSETTRPLT